MVSVDVKQHVYLLTGTSEISGCTRVFHKCNRTTARVPDSVTEIIPTGVDER